MWIKHEVKDIAVAEVRYSSVKFSLRLGDISVQSKTTTLDVFTSLLKEFLIPYCRCFPPSYCRPSFPSSWSWCEGGVMDGGRRGLVLGLLRIRGIICMGCLNLYNINTSVKKDIVK